MSWAGYRVMCLSFSVAFGALSIWNLFAGDPWSSIIAGVAGVYFGLRAKHAPRH